jgi:hypothetical protein
MSANNSLEEFVLKASAYSEYRLRSLYFSSLFLNLKALKKLEFQFIEFGCKNFNLLLANLEAGCSEPL